MTVEASDTSTVVYIDSLDPGYPAPSNPLSEMDNHLRLLKRTWVNTFPNVAGTVSASDVELSQMVGLTSPAGPALARAGALNWAINGDVAFTLTHTETDTPTGPVAPGWELVCDKTPSEVDVTAVSLTIAEALAVDLPYNVSGYLALARDTVTQSTASYVLRQRIPAVRAMAGRTFTLTGYFKSDLEFDVAPTLRQVFGTGGTPSDAVTVEPNATASVIAADEAWAARAWTFVLPSVAAKTFGTSASSDYLEVELDVPGSTTDTFSCAFTGVSLVEGVLADGYDGYPEEDPAVSRDRALSQYRELSLHGRIGVANSTTQMQITRIDFPSRMQRVPTVTAISMARYVAGTSATMTSLAATATVDGFTATAATTGLTAYNGYILAGSLACDARPGI